MRRFTTVALATMLTATGCGPSAPETGFVIDGGERYAVPNVLALQRLDDHIADSEYRHVAPEARHVVWIVATERPVDPARAAAEQVPRRLLDKESGRGIAIRVGPGNAFLVTGYVRLGPAAKPEFRSTTGGAGRVEIDSFEGRRVSGRLVRMGAKGGPRWNLPFSAEIQQAEPEAWSAWGTPLPRDGGEVGAALAASLAALERGDAAQVVADGVMPFPNFATESAERQRTMLERLQKSLAGLRVIGGLRRDDDAVLHEVIPANAPASEQICIRTMKLSGGAWRSEGQTCVSD